ncbi:hypothetical protein BDA96_08G118700 [Sorghum bicolor]|uniref:KIB1-4 beta-propeller domain-containing protein n=1 Tax=Sorghum bicolor TaxID=4558 RepID=A0A921U6V6_SORBI|nr:hypothetical protein BDA96_08G118700 [Sorghum bicolor]
MAFVEDQVHHVAAAVDAAAGNPVPVLAAPGAGVNNVHGGIRLESEERDWANLVQDAVTEISEKLLATDATEYIRLRAVCKPWRSSTDNDNRPTWEPCFFPRNWVMLQEDEDDDDATPAEPAALRRRRFVNVRTGATLWIHLPSFEEYGFFLASAEGLLLFYCLRTETVRLFNPLTTATAILPGFSGEPGLEGEPDLTAAGIVVDRRNAPAGDPIVVPNVVLVLVSSRRRSTVILCAKPGDDHWGTVSAGVLEVDDGDVLPFDGGLSQQGCFYIPTYHGDVLRVELYPQPHLVYVARPPGRARCTCGAHNVSSYLVPSLDDANRTGENDGMLLVRVFADDEIYVLRVHLGNGSYTQVPQDDNRTIFLPGLTLLTDRFPSLVGEEGYVHVNERIEDYIGNAV